MAQTKLLLDTNAYLRLARPLHPLLFREFGAPRYCLYVLAELDEELNASRRLQAEFAWADDPEYRDNRKHHLTVGRKEKRHIDAVQEFILGISADIGIAVSPVDARVLAHGQALGIPAVTDDTGMLRLASELEIRTFKSLELLKLMLDNGLLAMPEVRSIVTAWTRATDLPAGIHKDYPRLFGEKPRLS